MVKNSVAKRVISIALIVVTLFSTFAITANAASKVNAFNVPTSGKYAKVYTIAKSGKTIPYTSKSLSTRGTTSGASKSSYIDNAADELYLMDVGTTSGKTWAYVSYPVSSGRRNAYIYLSAISSAPYSTSHLYYSSSSGKFYCSTRKGGSTSSSYYVAKGDKVYVLAIDSTSGTNTQIMYPTSGNKWRIAWCKYSDARKYLDNATTTKATTSSKTYTGYVNTSSVPLVLRKTASSSSAALANMPKGSSLTVLDNKAKTNGFYHVKYNGKTGYASASYITFTKPSTTTKKANITTSSYSVSGNILTVKGARLSEYPLNSTWTSSRYANVNGKSVDMCAWQCCGYARYVQQKVYGCHEMNSSNFKSLYKNVSAKTFTASSLKTMITNAGVGAHLRVGKEGVNPHSMIIIDVTSKGFTITDANNDGRNTIRIATYTWNSYINSGYGNRDIQYIEVYKY